MNQERNGREIASWEPGAAFACFAGSILSLALGFAFTTNWILNEVRHPLLHAVGITLLIIGIPILILGGHCLDLMEKKNKRSSKELHSQGNGGPKRLHVVVGLVCLLSILYVSPATFNAQQLGDIQRIVTGSSATEANPCQSEAGRQSASDQKTHD